MEITDKEKNKLYSLLDTNPEINYRIKIVLLASEGYTVPEIRVMTDSYYKTIRKWIHKFNDIRIEELFKETILPWSKYRYFSIAKEY